MGATLEKKRLRDEVRDWNRKLEERVQEQVAQLGRLGRLKSFFSPQLAESIVNGGGEDLLKTHRREVVVVFLDLRGFTAFTDSAEPEEVMAVLGEYHRVMGQLILAHEGTLEHFAGDGILIFFNDPIQLEKPAENAISMALEMQHQKPFVMALSGCGGVSAVGHRAVAGMAPEQTRESETLPRLRRCGVLSVAQTCRAIR